jgi:hypothetical protein
MQSLKFRIEGSTECRGTVHGQSTEHYSRAEVLFTDGVRSTVHKRRYCPWRTIHGVLFTSHSSQSAGWWATPDLWGGSDNAEISSQIRSLGLLRAVVVLFSKLVFFDGLICVLALEINDVAVQRSVMLRV